MDTFEVKLNVESIYIWGKILLKIIFNSYFLTCNINMFKTNDSWKEFINLKDYKILL
jgi:hypothetical protein